MSTPSMDTGSALRRDEVKLDEAGRIAVRATLNWSGWGSPVGLSIFLVSVGFFLVCLHWAGLVH